jgi:hypothetical protein
MILYKYMSASTLKATVENSTLRFTIPSFFNDPFDCALSSEKGSKEETLKNLTNVLLTHFHRNRSGALCLTRNQFNLLMWAHYADNHQGAVIGIDTEIAELECESQNIITAKSGSVIYTSIRPSSCGAELPQTFDSKSDRATLEKMFLHKSIHWAYEEEVRVVRVIHPDFNETTVIHKDMAHLDVKVPKDAIKEIYLGSRFNKTPENLEIAQYIADNFDLIKFAQCYLNPAKWSINARAISKFDIQHGFFFL